MRATAMLARLCFVAAAVALTRGQSFEDKKALQDYLRAQGDVNIKPLHNQSETLNVNALLVIFTMQGLNEKTQVLKTRLSIVTYWYSDMHRWNTSDYGGTAFAKLSPYETWAPRFAIYNAEVIRAFDYSEIPMTVYSNGQVTWSVGGNFDTTCKVDVKYYPFDVQECPIEIGELYSEQQTFEIVPIQNYIDQSFYTSNDDWELTSTEITSHYHPGSGLTRLIAKLTLSRQPAFYVLNVIVPVTMLSMMNVLSFKIPATSGERVGYCVALFLTYMVLLGAISDSMPKVGSVSILQLYINLQLIMGMTITAVSILLVNAAEHGNNGNTATLLRRITCRLRHNPRKTAPKRQADDVVTIEKEEGEGGVDEESMTEEDCDVKELVKELDGRLFTTFLFFFVLINVTFMSFFLLRP